MMLDHGDLEVLVFENHQTWMLRHKLGTLKEQYMLLITEACLQLLGLSFSITILDNEIIGQLLTFTKFSLC